MLGIDQDNRKVWLTQASWDCDWYWGFGYIDRPYMHTHFDGLVWFKDDNNKYVYHINESPELIATTLTDREAWQLSDLMKSFYSYKAVAEITHIGSSHFTNIQKLSLKDKYYNKKINTKIMPSIFNTIYEILTPEN